MSKISDPEQLSDNISPDISGKIPRLRMLSVHKIKSENIRPDICGKKQEDTMQKDTMPEDTIPGKYYRQGAMTVEASFIMILVLAVLMLLIFCGFYMYDRCVMSGAVSHAAAYGARWGQVRGYVSAEELENLLTEDERYVFFGRVRAQAQTGSDRVTIRVEADRTLTDTAVLNSLAKAFSWKAYSEGELYCPRRERIIRIIRGIKKHREGTDETGDQA